MNMPYRKESMKLAETLEAWAETEKILALRKSGGPEAAFHKNLELNYRSLALWLRGAKETSGVKK